MAGEPPVHYSTHRMTSRSPPWPVRTPPNMLQVVRSTSLSKIGLKEVDGVTNMKLSNCNRIMLSTDYVSLMAINYRSLMFEQQ